nr:CrcB family protein [Corynebacterium epidermidicanis]
MLATLYVATGGFAGGALRYQMSRLNRRSFPVGTLLSNTLACLTLATVLGTGGAYLALGIGFAGALSTMSTFVKELVRLGLKHGTIYLSVTLVCGWLGFQLGLLLK